MLMPVISDSYRGVRVSMGVTSMQPGNMYIRLEFIGDSWKQVLDNPEIDGDRLASLMYLDRSTHDYIKDGSHPVFIWYADTDLFGDNISLFTFLADVFRRIDILSPFPRGQVIHPAIKSEFKKFLKSYAFKDTKEAYTNGSELVPMFRVLDALDMIETGRFAYCEACPVETPGDQKDFSVEEAVEAPAAKKKAKNTAKTGTKKGSKGK